MASRQNVLTNNPKATSQADAINVVILGAEGTGKTAVFKQLRRYTHSQYPENTFKRLNCFAFHNGKATFLISDVNIPAMPLMNQNRIHNISKGDGFILVYAIDDKESFDYVEAMKDYIISRKGEDVPIIIIGNKSDLTDRAIQYPIVDCLVSIEWEIKYLELSALSKDRFSLIIPQLLPSLSQPPLLPVGPDLDTFEFRGMEFRQRSSMDAPSCTVLAGTRRRHLSLFNDAISGQKSTQQHLSQKRNISLPNFLSWRRRSSNK